MTVLVATASRHGATEEIAERIGCVLVDDGFAVEVKELQDVEGIERYEAVVLGSAIYFGKWMKEAVRFVDAHAGELAERPTWLFGSGPITGDPPVAHDPNGVLARQIEHLVEATHAREHKIFAGKLEMSTLGLFAKLVARGVRAQEGDWRDLRAVDAWAAEIASALQRPCI